MFSVGHILLFFFQLVFKHKRTNQSIETLIYNSVDFLSVTTLPPYILRFSPTCFLLQPYFTFSHLLNFRLLHTIYIGCNYVVTNWDTAQAHFVLERLLQNIQIWNYKCLITQVH